MTGPLALAGALLVATAYLAAVETVVTRLDVVRAMRLVEEDRRGAAALLWLAEHRASSLNVLLVLTVVARVTLASVSAVVGWQLTGGAGGLLLAVVVVALLSLVVGEVAPRTVALRHLEATALRLAGSGRLVVRVADPLARLVVSLGRALVPRRHEVSGPYASDDELHALEVGPEVDDELEPEERAMLRSVLELADTIAREIMVPRPDMQMVPADAVFDDVVQVAVDRGFSRLPVHEPGDPDAVVGVVYTKDLLARLATAPEDRRWADLLRPPTYVPETKRLDDLLRELQAGRVHLALVVDEHGELVGLVTIEDILEEIVGEIVDEHDREEPLVETVEHGRFRVDARLPVDDLNELLGSDLPATGWDTVGGLVLGTLGRVPREGELIELDGIVITVERVQGRRVAKVLVGRAAAERASDGSAAAAEVRSDGDGARDDRLPDDQAGAARGDG